MALYTSSCQVTAPNNVDFLASMLKGPCPRFLGLSQLESRLAVVLVVLVTRSFFRLGAREVFATELSLTYTSRDICSRIPRHIYVRRQWSEIMTHFNVLYVTRYTLYMLHILKLKLKIFCDRRSVGQSLLVSDTSLGPMTGF
jgi:hypothetical protein